MRVLALILALAAALPAPAATLADGVRIVRVLFGWREAASFKRISEYFDGRENTGGVVILRTHPDQRGGYYFLTRLANPGTPRPIRFRLLVISPESTTPHPFHFTATLPARETVFNLGLTGADWASAKVNPVAWKLEVLDDSDHILATEQSYLWEKPPAE
ncbi:MAG: hypothetical protein ACHQ5A_06985 [Opitutales bacterium]